MNGLLAILLASAAIVATDPPRLPLPQPAARSDAEPEMYRRCRAYYCGQYRHWEGLRELRDRSNKEADGK